MICENCGHDNKEKPPPNKELIKIANDIYSIYPKKQGKAKGISKLVSLIKNKPGLQDEIKRSVIRYKKYCTDNNTEPQYIKQFSTFMGSWDDYGDDNYDDLLSTSPNNASDWSQAHT